MDSDTTKLPPESESAGTKELRSENEIATAPAEELSDSPPKQPFRPSVRVWTILIAVGFAGLLTALEATITSTALPSIVNDLEGGDAYVWAVNGYLLAMTALQPLYGQLANVYGRRWPTILATAAFLLGSGIAGGATNMAMLVAGRVIQGIGAGGINVLCEVLVCDVVPLRERGKYLGGMFGMIALGTALGPLFGGLIVQNTTWRWVFYLNLPVGGVALVLLVLFLHVNYRKEDSLASTLTKIDWLGNVIFIGAVSAVLIALAWAGAVYPWGSYRILVPLLVGLAGLAGFLAFEGSRFCAQPMMPLHLFSNRTSSTAFALTFLHSVTTLWVLYFLPVYFQGVLGSSPQRSGVQLLPTVLVLIPFGAFGGVLMTKIGRYRPLHHVGFALMTVSMGLLALLDEDSNTGSWVGFQIIGSAGAGIIIPTLLPAVMAPLAESDTALATSTWAFLRSFGQVWGTAIAAAVFNNRFDDLAGRITDAAVRQQVTGGQAYQRATAAFLDLLPPESRDQFVSVLSDSLRRSWFVSIAFAGLGFALVIFEKEIPLREELDTEYGVAEKTKPKGNGDVERSAERTA
ncbi:MFS general substrate transporter-like protein [Thermothelomyces thermophilus ATCC 42464]|uniref:MFS general substrate transporter-like protein n=1 Tax=Thermothelomyces thermophilus (strain ATCC 42464 / BCRC 31852 / DSM 1799) TaxID=573729 RepID=G2Q9A3_THET4|nr:MFS general substrate transporter-like protein [Thermothelomyces thermophilus ATCC 42464]AEO57195.1 MFS general substrate transporter-like protein [Thermothelomyces thermophilus ATCC 42464]